MKSHHFALRILLSRGVFVRREVVGQVRVGGHNDVAKVARLVLSLNVGNVAHLRQNVIKLFLFRNLQMIVIS